MPIIFSKLDLSLPKTVDEELGKAEWDASNQILKLTLPITNNHPF